MRKTTLALLGCAGISFFASSALLLWSIVDPPYGDMFSGLKMAGWGALAFWIGVLFLVVAATIALIRFGCAQFGHKKRRGNPLIIDLHIEHLP